MDFFEAVTNRRSIRKYQDRPVAKSLISQVLEAARLAPSWKNQQCWQFLVLTQRASLETLGQAFADTNPGKKAFTQAPAAIVACADPARSGVENGQEYYLADAAIAIEHICLAASALGLGTCWMGVFDEPTLKHQFNIPEGIRVVGVTPLGYPAQTPQPRPRLMLSEIAFMDKWGEPYVE